MQRVLSEFKITLSREDLSNKDLTKLRFFLQILLKLNKIDEFEKFLRLYTSNTEISQQLIGFYWTWYEKSN
jgi:hypothetical protein